MVLRNVKITTFIGFNDNPMQSNFLKVLSLYLTFVFLFSCSNDGGENSDDMGNIPEETDNPVIKDDYNYIALRNDGNLFTIGSKSGKVTNTGQIDGLEFNTVFNTITSSSTNTYIYEPWFDPVEGRLFIRDRNSGVTEKVILDFPEAFGDNPGFISLDWDENHQNLVGIVKQEFDSGPINLPLNVVRLDPETFEFSVYQDLDLNSAGYVNISASQLIEQKLYVSASKGSDFIHNDLLEIDLTAGTFTVLPQEGMETGIITFGSSPNSSKLIAFAPQLNTSYTGTVRPYVYNLLSREVEEISSIPRIYILQLSYKPFYNPYNGELVTLLGRDEVSIFNYNLSDGKYAFVPVANPEDLSSLIAIIDVVKL